MSGNFAVTGLPPPHSSNTPRRTRSPAAKNTLLGDEAHLDVELIEFAERAVGAGVLVTKARRDLEIAVEARHHEQLLELLGRLRQRVELAGMEPRRHQIIARALRARCGQNGGLKLEESPF